MKTAAMGSTEETALSFTSLDFLSDVYPFAQTEQVLSLSSVVYFHGLFTFFPFFLLSLFSSLHAYINLFYFRFVHPSILSPCLPRPLLQLHRATRITTVDDKAPPIRWFY